MTNAMATLVAALVGAIVGSFLNVCIYRLPRRKSIVWPGSACTACRRSLSWYENIPILSYALLRGRCRTCRAAIAIRYPLVEAITAAMFAGAWWHYGPGLLLVSRLLFGSALIVLFAIDLEHHLLPNIVTVPGIIVGLALSVVTEPGWVASLIGVGIGGGVLYAIAEAYYRLRHEEGLGMGDVKMLGMIGAFIGWKLTLVALMMASVAGSIVGLVVLAKGGGMKYALPFGTFLALGAGVAAVLGPAILNWYVSLW